MIDFDRGEVRTPQKAWQAANMARLKRSLIKVGAAAAGETVFEHEIWEPLMGAYENGLESASKDTSR